MTPWRGIVGGRGLWAPEATKLRATRVYDGFLARVAELADAPALGAGARRAWGFESPLSHRIAQPFATGWLVPEQHDARVERLGPKELKADLCVVLKRPLAPAPYGRMKPESQLVDEVVRNQMAGELTAADGEEISVELFLQFRYGVRHIPLDHRGVPRQRLPQRP
jgi:hypothetical protein